MKKNSPKREYADMRNKLIHEYFGVNLKVVWKAVKEDIPELKKTMSKLMNELKINKLL